MNVLLEYFSCSIRIHLTALLEYLDLLLNPCNSIVKLIFLFSLNPFEQVSYYMHCSSVALLYFHLSVYLCIQTMMVGVPAANPQVQILKGFSELQEPPLPKYTLDLSKCCEAIQLLE